MAIRHAISAGRASGTRTCPGRGPSDEHLSTTGLLDTSELSLAPDSAIATDIIARPKSRFALQPRTGLKLQGTQNKKGIDELAERSLRGANLWSEVKDRLDKAGGGLSGGQQQRLCIAREPCSALDPMSTLGIEDLIAELKRDHTIVIVTHNMQQAARVSDQTAFFNLEATGKRGRLIEINDTAKIFSNPDEKATENYISGRFG